MGDLAIALTPYAVEFRYPGEQASRMDVKRALANVTEIREFIRRKIQSSRK